MSSTSTPSPGDAGTPPPVRLKAESHLYLRGCRIRRAQLDRIWQLARDGFPADAHISITTKRAAGGIESEINGKSIDELLDGVARATMPGDPNVLDNIDLYISNNGIEGRMVYVSIKGARSEGVWVQVRDTDPGWVRGRIGGLKDLLVETQSPRWTGRGRARFIALPLGILISSVIDTVLNFTLTRSWPLASALLLAVGLWLVVGGGAFLAGARLDRRSRTQLLLVTEDQGHKIDRLNLAVLVATILGVIATTVGILVAHWDATHPH